jgi:hypothetical protein
MEHVPLPRMAGAGGSSPSIPTEKQQTQGHTIMNNYEAHDYCKREGLKRGDKVECVGNSSRRHKAQLVGCDDNLIEVWSVRFGTERFYFDRVRAAE